MELYQSGPSILAVEEALFRNITTSQLQRAGIEIIDPLPALREHVANEEPMYPPSDDGHRSELGLRVVAECVASRLR